MGASNVKDGKPSLRFLQNSGTLLLRKLVERLIFQRQNLLTLI
jgi:hypothetical protein